MEVYEGTNYISIEGASGCPARINLDGFGDDGVYVNMTVDGDAVEFNCVGEAVECTYAFLDGVQFVKTETAENITKHEKTFLCSNCWHGFPMPCEKFRYCPNCGAEIEE